MELEFEIHSIFKVKRETLRSIASTVYDLYYVIVLFFYLRFCAPLGMI